MLSRRIVAGGLAAIMALAGMGEAFAAPGIATTTVNVRSGPDVSYKVVDTLQPGERVDIQKCVSGWCYVGKAGTDGWVSDDYLQRISGPVIVPPPIIVRPPPIVVRPPHHRPPHHRPPRPRPPKPKPPGPAKPPICKIKPNLPACHAK